VTVCIIQVRPYPWHNASSANMRAGEMEDNQDHPYWQDAYNEWEYPTKEEYPEAFIWDCCDQPGDQDGCIVSRHVPKSERTTRVKM